MNDSVYDMNTAVLRLDRNGDACPSETAAGSVAFDDPDEAEETRLYAGDGKGGGASGETPISGGNAGDREATVVWRASKRDALLALPKRLFSRAKQFKPRRFPIAVAVAVGMTAVPALLRLCVGAAPASPLAAAAADLPPTAKSSEAVAPLSAVPRTEQEGPLVISLEAEPSMNDEGTEVAKTAGGSVRLIDAVEALTSGRFDAAESAYRALANANPENSSHTLVLQILGAKRGEPR